MYTLSHIVMVTLSPLLFFFIITRFYKSKNVQKNNNNEHSHCKILESIIKYENMSSNKS